MNNDNVKIYNHWKEVHGISNKDKQDDNLRWYCINQEQMARNIVLTKKIMDL